MTYRPYSTIKATGLEFPYTNDSGIFMPKSTPIKIKLNGGIDFINVSIENDAFALGGVTSSDSDNGSSVNVVTAGRIEDITTTFSFGDAVYISKSGNLTNIKPSVDIGGFVSGDYIVRIGTIAKNTANPLLKDLILELALVGQL